MDTPKQTALFWLNQGVATVPLCYRSKFPAGQSLIKSGLWQVKDGKIKGNWTPLKTKLPTEKMIEVWFEDGCSKNLALVTGWQNLTILDFDAPESYAAWFAHHLFSGSKVFETYRVTSNRGVHVYFYLSEPARLCSIQNAFFEVKCSGKLCTTPPSVHESGKAYRSQDDPRNIRTVKPEEILNYSPLALHPVEVVWPTRSRFAPTQPLEEKSIVSQIKEKVKVLSFFPNAIEGTEGYWQADCPFHGHKENFWISTQLNICGCYACCTGRSSMDVIEFFARLNKIETKEAIYLLSREV